MLFNASASDDSGGSGGSGGGSLVELTAAISKTIPAQRFNNLGSISYTVTFSEAIDATSFTGSDILNAGTATDLDWDITEITPNLVYQIEVNNVPSAAGTIIPKISTNDVFSLDGRGVSEAIAPNSEKIFFKSNEWVDLASMDYDVDSAPPPSARYAHSTSMINGKFYIFGGYDEAYKQDLHVYDPSAGANGTWSQVVGFAGSAPSPRYQHSASAIDGKLYIFGGRTGGSYKQDLHVYDPSAGANGTWSEVTGFAGSAPSARSGHSSSVIDGKLYIFGGSAGGNNLHVYDPSAGANGTWSEVVGFAGSAPSARSNHSASVVDGKIYIFGGTDVAYKQDLYVYDPSAGANGTWSEVTGFAGSAPAAREGHSASVIDGKLYIFGGNNGGVYKQDMHAYDPSAGANGTWLDVASLTSSAPSPRYAHSASVINDKLYIFGGNNGIMGSIFQNMFVYDPSAGTNGTWSKVTGFAGSAPSARSGHSASVVDGKIYVFGGSTTVRKQDLHVYDPSAGANGTWSEVTGFAGSAPSARSGHSSSVIDGKIYIFGGYDGAYKQDLHVYDPSAGANGTWSQVTGFAGSAPSARSGHSASVIDGKIYIFGGYDAAYKQDLHVYDPSAGANGTWSEVTGFAGSAPTARGNHSASVVDGKLYILWGRDGAYYKQDMHVYDPSAGVNGTWSEVTGFAGASPAATHAHSASVINDKLYIFGGSTQLGFFARQDLFNYFP